MKIWKILSLVLMTGTTTSNAQIFKSEPKDTSRLSVELQYVFSTDSGYRPELVAARGDTTIISLVGGSSSISRSPYFYSLDLGSSWDSILPIQREGNSTAYSFRKYPMDLGQGALFLNKSDTVAEYRISNDFGRTSVALFELPKSYAKAALSSTYSLNVFFPKNRTNEIWASKHVFVAGIADYTDFIRSFDNGVSWSPAPMPGTTYGLGTEFSLLFDQSDDNIWYVSLNPTSDWGQTIYPYYRTTDNGNLKAMNTPGWSGGFPVVAGVGKPGDLRAWTSGPNVMKDYRSRGFNTFDPNNLSKDPIYTDVASRIFPTNISFDYRVTPSPMTGLPAYKYFVVATRFIADTNHPDYPST
jgi:hypothetical protein